MAVRGVIFDIDGTLIDSVDLHAQAWQEALRHYGYEIEFGRARHEIGKGGDHLIPDLTGLPPNGSRFKELERFRSEIWKSKYLARVNPFPKVRQLFENILRDGKKIVLASSAKGDELKKYRQIAGIDDLVRDETSADDVDRSKPSPDAIEAALGALHHTDPETVVMIGDTPWDVIAAAKVQVRTLAVLCGGFPGEELRAAGAVAIYRDPADLLANYESSLLGSSKRQVA